MSLKKKYRLTIEVDENEDVCESLTEEYSYPDLCLMVDELDLTDYFDDITLELCKDCCEIALS